MYYNWSNVTKHICQMLHETSFQIIIMYSIDGKNQASELLWH